MAGDGQKTVPVVKLHIEINRKSYPFNQVNPVDISIPLQFNGEQPGFFGVPQASAKPYNTGGFIGDTRQGGSCNVEEYRLIPHCNGTHTECAGHIAKARISLHDILKQAFIPATLVSIKPQLANTTPDTYSPDFGEPDLIISAEHIEKILQTSAPAFLRALIIRTLPNDPAKKTKNYGRSPAPFFSLQAMAKIHESGIEHLLVDVPSVDRANDEGKMAAHHVYWEVPQGSHAVDPQNHSRKTITEMIFVPDEVADGNYLLNVQIPAFVADAAPSRPLLFALKEVG
jgi:kynurenine formamidase